ncbi:TetR/AcrR family transcriptional regulator [Aliamphritea spongicola]|uniref:TetR/AcrR family transcriptional regulator n=1 Tax=Aliamphritea spongicola TaxID=707589 RepID=UPI00196B61E5|nr:TetR/AcrR family transcriptional regulator [Aliamphritea spongicola]MBN3561055.1 TetR/AcrR family transcriptional regulator [Aliamphritea spongicola]
MTRQTLSQRKRAAIVEAAVLELSDKGFQAMSMDALAARAEVSKRTVYNHFASKELLFQEIAKLIFEQSSEVTAIQYQPDVAIDGQLTAYGRNEIELLKSRRFRDLCRVMIAECIHSPQLAAEAMVKFAEQEQTLDQWISAAIADGKLQSVDANYAANQFHGLIKAQAFWPQLLMGQPFPDDETCEQIISDAVVMFTGRYGV